MRVIATRKSEQNDAAIDPWTVVHFGVGLAAGLMNIPFWPAMAAAAVYEVLEQGLERSEFGQELFETSGPENFANAMVDLGIFAVGHWLGTVWNES